MCRCRQLRNQTEFLRFVKHGKLHTILASLEGHSQVIPDWDLSTCTFCSGPKRSLTTPVRFVNADTGKKILMRKSAAICSAILQKYTKVLMFHMIVSSVVLCLIEKWTVLNKHMKQLQVFQVKCLLLTCGHTLSDWQHIGPIMTEPRQAYYAF